MAKYTLRLPKSDDVFKHQFPGLYVDSEYAPAWTGRYNNMGEKVFATQPGYKGKYINAGYELYELLKEMGYFNKDPKHQVTLDNNGDILIPGNINAIDNQPTSIKVVIPPVEQNAKWVPGEEGMPGHYEDTTRKGAKDNQFGRTLKNILSHGVLDFSPVFGEVDPMLQSMFWIYDDANPIKKKWGPREMFNAMAKGYIVKTADGKYIPTDFGRKTFGKDKYFGRTYWHDMLNSPLFNYEHPMWHTGRVKELLRKEGLMPWADDAIVGKDAFGEYTILPKVGRSKEEIQEAINKDLEGATTKEELINALDKELNNKDDKKLTYDFLHNPIAKIHSSKDYALPEKWDWGVAPRYNLYNGMPAMDDLGNLLDYDYLAEARRALNKRDKLSDEQKNDVFTKILGNIPGLDARDQYTGAVKYPDVYNTKYTDVLSNPAKYAGLINDVPKIKQVLDNLVASDLIKIDDDGKIRMDMNKVYTRHPSEYSLDEWGFPLNKGGMTSSKDRTMFTGKNGQRIVIKKKNVDQDKLKAKKDAQAERDATEDKRQLEEYAAGVTDEEKKNAAEANRRLAQSQFDKARGMKYTSDEVKQQELANTINQEYKHAINKVAKATGASKDEIRSKFSASEYAQMALDNSYDYATTNKQVISKMTKVFGAKDKSNNDTGIKPSSAILSGLGAD